jgi:ABC-type glycerol-3-phosphate transport system substrate-binding protein
MQVENQINVFRLVGAVPALTAALTSPEVNVEDPYFGGQRVSTIFIQAMETAIPFPRVRQWQDIESAFNNAMYYIATGQLSVQDALDQAAQISQDALGR